MKNFFKRAIIRRQLFSIILSLLILTMYSSTVLSESYLYDANGNLRQDGKYCYEYNDANKLSKVTNCAGTTVAQYWYDYTGRKIKAVENGVTTLYPFDDVEVDSSGGKTIYFFANGERVARKDPSGAMHYYSGDHLGSTSVVTDSSGALEEKTKYYPYGSTRSGGTNTKYLYNSKELSRTTGLYDYGARQYNPETMRFVQPDSIIPDVYDPQTLNRYSYVKNNPVRYTDPSGHYLESALDLAFIAMDLNDIYNDPNNAWNWGALGADVAGLALPGATGGRLLVKGAEHAGDAMKVIDKGVDVVKGAEKVDNVLDAGKIAVRDVEEQATKEYLENVAKRAEDAVSETGRVGGTLKHSYAEKIINAERPDLFTEVSYKDKLVVKRGTPGSVRVDTVKGSLEKPTAVFDYKFGNGKLTQSRIEEIQRHIPNANQCNIYQVKPIWGK